MKINLFCLIGGLLFLWCYLGALECIRPLFFLHDDNASSYLGGFLLSYDTLISSGELAQINFYQYGGEPFMEQGQSGVFYPPCYLCVALAKHINHDVHYIIEWMMAIHLTGGLIGFWAWLRKSVTPFLAILAGLLWVSSPYVLLICSNWVAMAYIVCYLPWIFMALDKLCARPGPIPCLCLFIPITLIILSGAMQLLIYAFLFIAFYIALQFRSLPLNRLVRIILWGGISLLASMIISTPLFGPMLHAAATSVERGKSLPLAIALQLAVHPIEFMKSQFFQFGYKSLGNANSSYFFSAEWILLPLAFLGLLKGSNALFLRLFRYLFLALIALILSTKLHLLLSLLPLFSRFRWPFKVLIYFKFFFLLFIIFGIAKWIRSSTHGQNRRLWISTTLIVFIFGANLVVTLTNQNSSLLSHAQLEKLTPAAFESIDPAAGRVLAVGQFVKDGSELDRYLAYCFSTTYKIPSIGGYDPLVHSKQSFFGLGLNLPNIDRQIITPEVRQDLNQRCVRYLIVDENTFNGSQVRQLPHMIPLLVEPERTIFENRDSNPMVVSEGETNIPMHFQYKGNSVVVPLHHQEGPVGVSLSDSLGWWYRTDQSSWKRAEYHDYRMWGSVTPEDHLLELTFFDPFFYEGINISLVMMGFTLATGVFIYFSKK